ncbi:MAG: LysM peptidoglycan-binding domain-containing protein [Aggregatilineales bacterium]
MFHSQNPRLGRLIASVLALGAVVAFGSASVAERPAQAQAQVCASTYVVKSGDDLYRIALAAGTTWPVLQQLNGLVNANIIFVGQILCLPGSIVLPIATPASTESGTPVVTATPTTVPTSAPVGSIVLPPIGIFPSIAFDSNHAAPGNTITITGINFPTNGIADVYIKPLLSPLAYMPVAQTVTSATGTVNFPFAIPTVVNGQALQGYAFSVLVKERTTGYYGFSFFYNAPRA